MDGELQERFVARWRQYFGEAELPIACYYTDKEDAAPPADTPTGHACVIGALAEVRHGHARRFDGESVIVVRHGFSTAAAHYSCHLIFCVFEIL